MIYVAAIGLFFMGLYLIIMCFTDFIRAINVLFYHKEQWVAGYGILFFIYQKIIGKDNPKCKLWYDNYVNKTMKPYSIMTLIFAPVGFLLGALFIIFAVIIVVFNVP